MYAYLLRFASSTCSTTAPVRPGACYAAHVALGQQTPAQPVIIAQLIIVSSGTATKDVPVKSRQSAAAPSPSEGIFRARRTAADDLPYLWVFTSSGAGHLRPVGRIEGLEGKLQRGR
jgi:hypothetical protein